MLGERKLVPALGVYAVRVTHDGEAYGGMMNVGRRPTFESDGAVSLEAHLFDFSDDVYGRALSVEFVARLRDEAKFDGVEAIVAQLREDERAARTALY